MYFRTLGGQFQALNRKVIFFAWRYTLSLTGPIRTAYFKSHAGRQESTMDTLDLPLPRPYKLRPSLRLQTMGSGDPTMRLREGSVAGCLNTPEGPVTYQAMAKSDHLLTSLEGPGSQWLQPHLAGMLGLEDDPTSFQPTGKLERIAKQHCCTHLPKLPVIFDRLVSIILQQLIAYRDACENWARLVRRHGTPAPGDYKLWLPPLPEQYAAFGDYDLIACGILPKQARLVLKLARCAERIERLAGTDQPKLIKFLLAQRGIGPWTVGFLQGSGLGDADAVMPGDIGFPRTVAHFFEGPEVDNNRKATDEDMLRLLEPYRPHRFRTLNMLIAAGVGPPRKSPRRPGRRPW